MMFVYADRLVYVYLVKPHEQLSEQVKHLVKAKRFKEAMVVIEHRGDEQQHLSTRSVLFMLAWVPLALLMVSSTGRMLGVGMVLGIGLHLVYEIAVDWGRWEKLKTKFFWQIKRPIGDQEVKMVLGGFGLMLVIVSMLMV